MMNAVPATIQVFPTFPQTGDSFALIGTAGAGLTGITGVTLAATTGLGNQTANITGNLSGSVGSVTGAVGSVTGNVGGNVVGSVASVTAGVTVTTNNDKTGYTLSAAGVQAVWDALTSALTAVGSIGKKLADWTIGTAQTGDAFARLGAPAGASVSADIAAVKAETANILTDTAEIGAAGAGLTALATASNLATVDTVVDAINAQTTKLTFNVANEVAANTESINNVAVIGAGTAGDKWRA